MRNVQKYNPSLPNSPVKKERLGDYKIGGIMIDGKHIADTLRCVHCSASWVVQPGSGKKRGWCVKCKGPLCGSPDCDDACVPLEMRLQEMENGWSRGETLRKIEALPKHIAIQGKDLSHL